MTKLQEEIETQRTRLRLSDERLANFTEILAPETIVKGEVKLNTEIRQGLMELMRERQKENLGNPYASIHDGIVERLSETRSLILEYYDDAEEAVLKLLEKAGIRKLELGKTDGCPAMPVVHVEGEECRISLVDSLEGMGVGLKDDTGRDLNLYRIDQMDDIDGLIEAIVETLNHLLEDGKKG